MVQILPAVQRNKTFLQSLSEGIGKGLEAYGEMNQRRKLQEALGRVGDIYGDPKLNEQQRLVQAYQQLAGAGRPELGQHLGSQLSRLGLQQQSFQDKIMNQQQLAHSMQNLQELYADPNLTEEQKIFGAYQELSQNPTLANNLLGSLHRPEKAREEDLAGQQFAQGYEAILSGDNDSLNEILQDPQTSHKVKKQLTDLFESSKVRKDVAAKELRNRQSFVKKSYQQALNLEFNRLKSEPLRPSERKEVKKRIKDIESSMGKDLKRLTKDPDSYGDLAIWNLFPDEGENSQESFQEEPPIMFDSNNPDHRMEAAKLFQQYGDKEKVREILRKKYKGL